MALAPYRLGPFGGIDPRRMDSRAIDGSPLKGGYNVEIVDGEWWTRPGMSAFKYKLLSEWFDYLVTYYDPSGSFKTYLVGHYAVLQINVSFDSVTVPYTQAKSETITFTTGSANATSSTTLTQDQIIIAENTAYRITNVPSSTAIVLDRVYEGAGGALGATKVYNPIGKSQATASNGPNMIIGRCDFTFFRQYVTHAAGDLWTTTSNSPAVTEGGIYMIITTGMTDPRAFRVDTTAALITDLWRDTSLGLPGFATSPGGNPRYCTVYKDRLFLAFAGDPFTGVAAQNNAERTIWYTSPFDMLLWHTGIAGNNGTPNFVSFTEGDDDITGIRPLGDDLVVHRERSQHIGQYQGSQSFPFQFFRNDQGIGCNAGRSLVTVEGRHYFWTQSGPATFDGSSVQLIAKELYMLLLNYNGMCNAPDMASNFDDTDVVSIDDPVAGVVYFVMSTVRDPAISSNDGSTVLCYSYRNGNWWLLDYEGAIYGGGFVRKNHHLGAVFFSKRQGTIVAELGTSAGTLSWSVAHTGEDAGLTAAAGLTTIENMAQTRWYDFQVPGRKKFLGRVDLELRSIAHEDPFTKLSVTGLGPSDTIYLALDVFVDHKIDTAYQTLAFTYTLSQFPTALEGFRTEPILSLRLPCSVQGECFSFRLRNALPSPNPSGYKKAPFRLSEITAWIEPRESGRPVSGN